MDFWIATLFPRGRGNGEVGSPLNSKARQDQIVSIKRCNMLILSSLQSRWCISSVGTFIIVYIYYPQCASISTNLCNEMSDGSLDFSHKDFVIHWIISFDSVSRRTGTWHPRDAGRPFPCGDS